MAFLGIDVGTSGTKALVLSRKGTVLATAEAPHELLTPRAGWTEQRPEGPGGWWDAVIAAARAALRKAGKREPVEALGLSGQMHGSVFLDKRGRVLRPALLWNDQRTAAQCREIEQKAGGRQKLIDMVSNPALTGFTAPKILWLREHEPKRFDQCAQVLLPKDYIRFRLTGEYATEVSDASGTLLLDVKRRRWHDGLLRLLDLSTDLLPRVTESQEVSGHLTPAAADALGLPAGLPVVGGGGDQAAGAVGTGVVQAGLLSAAMGTSGVLFAASAAPVTDPDGRVHTMCHAIPGTWCVFGCMLSAGGSLQWMRNTFFADALQKLTRSGKDPGALYPQMMKLAQAAPAGAEGLLFLPYLTGERCPHADPDARGAFIGLTPRHGLPALLRAAVEGITFGMREQVAIFRELGIPVREIRASGGGARSPFWRQLQADIYAAPVVTINVAEGAALGAALLAAVGAGAYATVPEACAAVIRVQERSRPRAKMARFYDERFAAYQRLYPALQPCFPHLDACG
jgi:xylulokinase